MSKMIIGLTGGIGCGKTTVSNFFAELGIDVIDADIAARIVVQPGKDALVAIEQRFGSDIIAADGQLNRAKLRRQIFSQPDDKTWLNNLLHPLIRQEIISQLRTAKSDYCLLVAPLLLENKLDKLVDRVLVVDVDEASQIARTIARDTSSETEVKRIIASQIPREQRLKYADDIIKNEHINLKEMQQLVIDLDHKYRLLSKSN